MPGPPRNPALHRTAWALAQHERRRPLLVSLMARPNGTGGWDLTDEDVAEVMAASFGTEEEPSPTD